jgi:hypothetical protein
MCFGMPGDLACGDGEQDPVAAGWGCCVASPLKAFGGARVTNKTVFAASSPAWVRSIMVARSSWAKAAMMVSRAVPIAPVGVQTFGEAGDFSLNLITCSTGWPVRITAKRRCHDLHPPSHTEALLSGVALHMYWEPR